MKIEKLGLQHKPILAPLLKGLKTSLSEYSFSTLYLFRFIHEYEIIFNNQLLIKGKTRDGFQFIMPTVSLKDLKIEDWEVDFIYPISEIWLKEIDLSKFTVTFNENDNDYIYSIEKMQHYPGRHLSKKRNLVHQFLELYVAEGVPFTSAHEEDALNILEKWHALHGEDDYASAMEAITLQEELGLEGRIYYIDKQPVGFILTEDLTTDMVLFHIVKADVRYKGIYQFIYQDFAQHLPNAVHWLNMEQDLGIPALRQAKHSYSPDDQLKKFRIKKIN